MPKKPNQAELDAANGAALDPIIDALLEHLPAPGDYWATDDRKRWLDMMTLAFDMIYDDQPPENTPAFISRWAEPRQHGT